MGRRMRGRGMERQPSGVSEEQMPSIAAHVLQLMDAAGVSGLPRNYQVFYEAYAGSNPDLREEVSALGACPHQSAIDEIARKYFASSHRDEIVEDAHGDLMRKIEDIMTLLGKEKCHLEKYGIILDRTSDGLGRGKMMTNDILQKVIGIMAVATTTTIEQNKQIVASIVDKSTELEQVKAKLEEYKKLADTDPLTQIWNRRAFDRASQAIYESNRGVIFSALILADIDCFKEVNDRHGHPVGDKILQHVANIFRSSAPTGAFVARTGGEEFALIVEGLTEDATARVADEIRLMIEKTPFIASMGLNRDPVTISMGICMASEATGPDDLYSKADRALYASKSNGRNCVTRYPVGESAKPRKNWMMYRKD